MKIFEFFSAQKLKYNIVNIIKRFSIGIIIIFIITTLYFVLLRASLDYDTSIEINKILFSLIITFFLSLGCYLGSETYNISYWKKQSIQLFPILFGYFFYKSLGVNLEDYYNIISCILTGIGVIGFLYIAPFLQKIFSYKSIKKDIIEQYYSFFYNLSTLILISFILGGILFGLGVIGISALFALFDIREYISDKIYGDWAIVSLSFITPIFALTQMPQKESFQGHQLKENIFFSFLVKYIAIPFIYVYFIILYAYSIKVLFHFHQWPKGEVSWLVIGFSIFGYLIYMFSSSFEGGNSYIKFFRKCFPFVVIPQLFMLFYAIYLRINQYDITINRYFVVIFGIWLALLSLYFIFSKYKQIYYIPAVLTLFILVISLGPWGIYSLPESRQLERLKTDLTTAGILQNGSIIPLKNYTDISPELSREIYNEMRYLSNYHDGKSLKLLFENLYTQIESKEKKAFEMSHQENLKLYANDPNALKHIQTETFRGVSNWTLVSELSSGIKVQDNIEIDHSEIPEILYFSNENDVYPLEISGYKKLYQINKYDFSSTDTGKIHYDSKTHTITLKRDNIIIDTIQTDMIDTGLGKYYQKTKKTILNKDNNTYILKGKKGEYKLILDNISIINPDFTGTINPGNSNTLNGYVLQK